MAEAISQLYSKSSSRADQNKAGVRLRQFTQIQLRRHLKWYRTSQRQRDIAKIFAEKVEKLLKHNRKLNSPKTNLNCNNSRLVEINCYARKDGVIPK